MKETFIRRLVQESQPMDSVCPRRGMEKDIKAKGEKIIKTYNSMIRCRKAKAPMKKHHAADSIITPDIIMIESIIPTGITRCG